MQLILINTLHTYIYMYIYIYIYIRTYINILYIEKQPLLMMRNQIPLCAK